MHDDPKLNAAQRAAIDARVKERHRIFLAAVKAAPADPAISWWPEMAPLTKYERKLILDKRKEVKAS